MCGARSAHWDEKAKYASGYGCAYVYDEDVLWIFQPIRRLKSDDDDDRVNLQEERRKHNLKPTSRCFVVSDS